MDEKTREALECSIKKWEAIVAGTGKDLGTANCPLCQLFLNPAEGSWGNKCEGCPVMDRTGLSGCVGTPYYEYENIKEFGSLEAKQQAALELAFLKSLRPAASLASDK